MNTDEIYSQITERFVAQLKAGTVPWRKPWKSGSKRARNLASGKPYQGINYWLLQNDEFASSYWATFNQVSKLGGKVKAGSKSRLIVFYSLLEKSDRQGNPVFNPNGARETFHLMRYSRVFNLEQTEGLADPDAGKEPAQAESGDYRAAQAIADGWQGCPVEYLNGRTPCYSPTADRIYLPPRERFHTGADFFHTLYHEMVHATGHASRLGRLAGERDNKFGSADYSKEELIAEMGAAFVSTHAEILCEVQFEQSAAYLAEWLKVLEGDSKFVVKAASAAQKAADWILGNKEGE